MLDIIETPEQANAAWFTAMFASAGIDTEVTKVTAKPVGTGQMAENARFSLAYQPGAASENLPRTLVGKFPSQNPASRAAGAHGGYALEVNYYRSVDPTVEIVTPRCYAALLADDNISFTLMLEDMAPAEQGNQILGCNPDEAAAAVRNVAGLHGPRWSDPTLLDLPGISAPDDPDRLEFLQLLMTQLTPGFIERYRSHLQPGDEEILSTFAERTGDWAGRNLAGFGLVHGDYRLDNLMFDKANSTQPVSTVDWQTLSVGASINDVSYFLGNGMSPEARRQHERDLVDEYHRALTGFGVSMSSGECFENYRWGSFHGLLITVLGSMMVVETERGDEMFVAMVSRALQQIRDLDALDLLDGRSRPHR